MKNSASWSSHASLSISSSSYCLPIIWSSLIHADFGDPDRALLFSKSNGQTTVGIEAKNESRRNNSIYDMSKRSIAFSAQPYARNQILMWSAVWQGRVVCDVHFRYYLTSSNITRRSMANWRGHNWTVDHLGKRAEKEENTRLASQ